MARSIEERLVFSRERLRYDLTLLLSCLYLLSCCRMLSHITLGTRLVDGVTFVMARLIVAVVRICGRALTSTQPGDTCCLSCDVILSVGILVVTVCIVVIDILQGIEIILRRIAIASTEIVLVKVVCHLSVTEVVTGITRIGSAVHTIDHGVGTCCWLILEAAMQLS